MQEHIAIHSTAQQVSSTKLLPSTDAGLTSNAKEITNKQQTEVTV